MPSDGGGFLSGRLWPPLSCVCQACSTAWRCKSSAQPDGGQGFESDRGEPVVSASRRWSNRSRLICEDGLGTSATVKRLRYCSALKRGYTVDSGRRCGSNGSRVERDFSNFAKGGVGKDLAAQTAGSPHGHWTHRQLAPPGHRFAKCLLYPARTSASDRAVRFIRRTAGCGPAC